MSSKHSKSDENPVKSNFVIDKNILKELTEEAISTLSKDLCYPENLRSKISSSDNIEVSCSLLLQDVQSLFRGLSSKGDAEKYYENYYTNIVFCAEVFFPDLEKPLCTLLAKRLGDKILSYFKRPTFRPVIKPMEISQRELDSLQYLGGYVVRKILRKTKNCKNYRNQDSQGIILSLECMITNDNIQEQRLISATITTI